MTGSEPELGEMHELGRTATTLGYHGTGSWSAAALNQLGDVGIHRLPITGLAP
jgi:hypothetical protein